MPRRQQCRGSQQTCRAASSSTPLAAEPIQQDQASTNGAGDAAPTARLVAVVADGALSRLGRDIEVTSEAVLHHMATRLSFVDPGYQLEVYTDADLLDLDRQAAFMQSAAAARIVYAEGIQNGEAAKTLAEATGRAPTFVAFDCVPQLHALNRLGGLPSTDPGPWQQLQAGLPWTPAARAQELAKSIQTLWERHSSDDLVSLFLVLIDAFIVKVPRLDSLRASGPLALARMIKNCGPQIFACVNDPDCKAALDCLQSCSPTDQVCSYRCIVSHESQLLEDFSLCILQKHNCLGKSADIPALPDPPPMGSFRGRALSHDLAEALFIGWLGREEWSWRVVAGQNAAYDQFPCQYQIFYRGKAKRSLWYDPVFQVRTLDGRTVWRRRHYRVRRAEIPGTFHFSVLDNGVISKEFWRIVDVPDDLSWALFAYSGAASAAGQVYTGAVLCTPDGIWPADSQEERINRALRLSGIEPWELFRVDNSCCQGMPLGVPEKDAASNPAEQSLVLSAAPS
ncbi:probable violaxanthin de-epoxidase, chloroplastic [Coccomyxa sp. Obi]|nr:probable violaxanthin de-epoxidase, chloroplastic [Coccomyxa sp. Obi]